MVMLFPFIFGKPFLTGDFPKYRPHNCSASAENRGLGRAFCITMFATRTTSPIIAIMFYEVHILDRRGKTKKVLSSKFLSKRHWDLFPETTSRKVALKKSQIKIEQTPLKNYF